METMTLKSQATVNKPSVDRTAAEGLSVLSSFPSVHVEIPPIKIPKFEIDSTAIVKESMKGFEETRKSIAKTLEGIPDWKQVDQVVKYSNALTDHDIKTAKTSTLSWIVDMLQMRGITGELDEFSKDQLDRIKAELETRK